MKKALITCSHCVSWDRRSESRPGYCNNETSWQFQTYTLPISTCPQASQKAN